jgi:hypothetical protein
MLHAGPESWIESVLSVPPQCVLLQKLTELIMFHGNQINTVNASRAVVKVSRAQRLTFISVAL